MSRQPKVTRRALAKANQYAVLEPEFGHPDHNAAIVLAKEVVRLDKALSKARRA